MAWFRRKKHTAEVVPWVDYVGAAMLRNRDDSLSRVFRMRGPDFTGLSRQEIGSRMHALNNTFKRVEGHWSLHFHRLRLRLTQYTDAPTSHPVLLAFDAQRKRDFLDRLTFRNYYYLTIRRRAALPGFSAVRESFMTRPPSARPTGMAAVMHSFRETTDHLAYLLRGVLAECEPLLADELATYLCRVGTGRDRPIRMPSDRYHLNWKICTEPFEGGWEPMLGRQHLAFCVITMFPDTSFADMQEKLDHLPFSHEHVARWIAHTRQASRGMFRRIQTSHVSHETSTFQESLRKYGNEPRVLDTHQRNQATDVDVARQEVSGGYVAYGHFTSIIKVLGESPAEAEERILAVKAILEDEGFSATIETEETRQAFFAMQPGDVIHGKRRYLLSTYNISHLSPGLKASWEGPDGDAHLRKTYPKAGPWFLAHTEDTTLLRVVNHVLDVGHTAVLGPTGAGKTWFLNFTAASWLAAYYEVLRARVLRISIGRSDRALALCLGGRYDDLSVRQPVYQPLRHIDDPDYFGFAYELVMDWLEAYKVEGLARIRSYIRDGLEALCLLSPELRTLEQFQRQLERQSKITQRGLSTIGVGSEESRARQHAETNRVLEAQWAARMAIEDLDKARLMSGSTDDWSSPLLHIIEVGSLLRQRRLASALLPYLAKRARMSFTGDPVLYQVDEDALVLSMPKGEEEQADDLRSLRKANASLMVATHSLVDVMASLVGSLIIESCQTMFLLANPAAHDPKITAVYEQLGCTAEEIHDVATMRPQGEYYLRTTYANRPRRRKFAIVSAGAVSALCDSATDEDHELMDKLEARYAPGAEFAIQFLRAKGYAEQADEVEQRGGILYAAD